MIQAIEIRNFQSLHHVSVDLAKLTVIVGPSSAGKSAFTRAMRTLTSNKRGNEFITHGERIASISATTEKGTVTLTRGKGTNDNAYHVIPAEHPEQQRTYTKLGGETPPEVSRFLGIEAKDPINYAGQFDKPYMLDDSGGEVARVLGALTNVNVIFEGARESNRRKLAHAATLRTRADDLQAIRDRVPQFRIIKQQDEALTRAETRIESAATIQRSIARLTEAIEALSLATQTIDTLSVQAARPVPSDDGIVSAAARLTAYRDALREQQQATAAVTATRAAYDEAESAQQALEADYVELVGTISDTLHGWFAAVATDSSRKRTHDGKDYVEVDYAVEVFTQYLETKATA
jgi:DNA repair ATPase RecN